MSKNRLNIITSCIILTLIFFTFNACEENPEFSNTPRIEFNSVTFVQNRTIEELDSLIISIDFEDGDGNLGLDSQGDEEPPFNLRNFYNNKTGRVFNPTTDTYGDLLTLSDRIEIDTLPVYNEFDFPCLIWDINPSFFYDNRSGLNEYSILSEVELNDNFERIPDIVYFQANERHNNIIVRIFRDENNNGRIEEQAEAFDWRKIIPPQCNESLDGRFPVGPDGVLNDGSPKEGTIVYNFVLSLISEILTEDRTLKLQLYIYDRAGNRSNIVESPEFTLREIQTN